MNGSNRNARQAIPLQTRVTCPHCWTIFPPEQALWVSQHPELLGDPRLGGDQQQRFLPTRFTVDGAAIDARGFACRELACPGCHLTVPRAMFELPPAFYSILGAPSCGKSYFLAAMTWQLRQVLPKHFGVAFNDADPASNQRLHEYEEMQFFNADEDSLVAIAKTEVQGDLYDTVLYGEQSVTYPRPFLFSFRPTDSHPNVHASARLSRALCLYDNAGESFLPGQDSASSPVTRHLALSQALFFLFDPTQDPRFRRACRGKSSDPQMQERSARTERERPVRQETILLEAAQRVRRHTGVSEGAKHKRPLVLIVTKFDSWSPLLGLDRLDPPWVAGAYKGICALKLGFIEGISAQVRELLWNMAPEVVSAAESFAEQVIYIPVSATGGSPEVDAKTGATGFRPKNIQPMWTEIPLLYTLSKWSEGLIPVVKDADANGREHTNGDANAKRSNHKERTR